MDYSAKGPNTQNDAIALQQNPTAALDPESACLRLLLIAPASPPPHLTGGMDVAVANVAAELRRRGWVVDMPLAAASESSSGDAAATSTLATLHVRLSLDPPPLQHRLRQSRLRSLVRLPQFLRGYIGLLVDVRTIRTFNENLAAVERVLKSAPQPDAILLFSGYATPGICSLALALNPGTVLVSTAEPALELKLAWSWALMRRIWSWRLKGQVHPFLYRPASAQQMKCVVFASEGWKEEAVRHGLNASCARTIYFGVPPSPVAARAAPRGRLLCVGRMNRDKGLHHFVEAMPAIRASVRGATLTVIARREDDAYQASIVETIGALRLAEAVKILPRVSASELESAYAGHDALLYMSAFREPVPLVMMEAFMAGLPVIIAAPLAPSPLVKPEHTCLCFDPRKPATLVEAIRRVHVDAALRARLTQNARELVDGPFSLDRMGAQYDGLLRMVASKSEKRI